MEKEIRNWNNKSAFNVHQRCEDVKGTGGIAEIY